MITFTLRPGLHSDLPAIKSLIRTARINPIGLNWSRFTVVINNQGEVIACGQIKPHQDGSHELASLVVDPAYRGQGIARSLVEHLVEIYQGELYLMCRSSLGRFYQKFGFEPIIESQMPAYFHRISRLASLVEILRKEGETLLVMHRPV